MIDLNIMIIVWLCAGPEISSDLVQLLQSKLDDSVLEILTLCPVIPCNHIVTPYEE